MSFPIVADEIIIPIPENLPTDSYQIVVGFYNFETGQRLSVPDHPANEVELLDVSFP